MNKVASYLQTHLSGEVFDNPAVRKYFSTDASVLEVAPSMVVYPRSTNDVRKVARFAWQLAEKGHTVPLTARGSGTDLTGAAIGKGIILVFPAHLNKILELDTQQKLVRVQPGLNFKSLQETIQTHGLFLPSFPASYEYSTIGGAIANNAAGESSLKYGPIAKWVDKLEVVLANGELIQTGRISKKEVEKKKGLATLEGELYRTADGVLAEFDEQIKAYYRTLTVSKDTVGYNLRDVKHRDGSIDLTPLFVGSQGTLGVITEAILKVASYNPRTALVVAAFDELNQATEAVERLRDLQPSALEIIDSHLIGFAEKEQGVVFPEELVEKTYKPAALVFVQFDNDNWQRERRVKHTKKILRSFSERLMVTEDLEEQERLWAIRQLSAVVVNYDDNGKTAVPIVEDAAVPHDKLNDLFQVLTKLFQTHHLEMALWGHAGDANIRAYPLLDLSKLTDRQKVSKLMSDYYKAVVALGGTISAEHNDGRLRAPFVHLQVGDDMMAVFEKLKTGFDQYGILNPGVKTGTTQKQLFEMLRKDYSLAHLSSYLPRT